MQSSTAQEKREVYSISITPPSLSGPCSQPFSHLGCAADLVSPWLLYIFLCLLKPGVHPPASKLPFSNRTFHTRQPLFKISTVSVFDLLVTLIWLYLLLCRLQSSKGFEQHALDYFPWALLFLTVLLIAKFIFQACLYHGIAKQTKAKLKYKNPVFTLGGSISSDISSCNKKNKIFISPHLSLELQISGYPSLHREISWNIHL